MANVLSIVALDFGQGVSPAAQVVTVPGGAAAWLLVTGFSGEGGTTNLASVTPSFGSVADLVSLPAGGNDTGVACAHGTVTATGAQTLAVAWSAPITLGPPVCVVFLADVGAVRDSAVARGTWQPIVLPEQTVDSAGTDLVLAFESHIGETAPATPAGCTSLATATVLPSNGGWYAGSARISRVDAPGAAQTSITPSAQPYPGAVLIAYPDAGAPPPPRRRTVLVS